jgi:TrmH family RNA methyltransferase
MSLNDDSTGTSAVTHIASRSNPFIKTLRKLAHESTAYRKEGLVWLEGDHLCRAALARGWSPQTAVFSESFWPEAPAQWSSAAGKTLVIADALWSEFSALESPAPMGFVMALPGAQAVQADAASVVLDRVQDAGNVGSILRSAAAFGFRQVLALKGTAALWSPKVLRAGMGAHFGLQLVEGLELEDLRVLTVPLVVTSSHEGAFLHQQDLPSPCAWVMGHEGQGVSAGLSAMARLSVRIAQPGGEESLNVGAAAAICLYASAAAAQRS